MQEIVNKLIGEIENLKKRIVFLESSVSEIKANTSQNAGIWGNFSKYLKQSLILVYKDEKMLETFEQVMKSLIDEQVFYLKDYTFEKCNGIEIRLSISDATRGDYVFIDSESFGISELFCEQLCNAITKNIVTAAVGQNPNWEFATPEVYYIICTKNPENVPEILREQLPIIDI